MTFCNNPNHYDETKSTLNFLLMDSIQKISITSLIALI